MCDDIDYKIGVMQAVKEGKVIECRFKDSQSWSRAISPKWDWSRYDYRVKPEPKEDWVVEYIDVAGKWDHYAALHEIAESGVKTYIKSVKGFFSVPPTFRYRRIEPVKE